VPFIYNNKHERKYNTLGIKLPRVSFLKGYGFYQNYIEIKEKVTKAKNNLVLQNATSGYC